MDVQSVIALLIVLAALGYVTRGLWRKLRPAGGSDGESACASGCGCTPASAPARPARERARR
ncbi:MAG TPA: hypothetical protein VF048_01990 [Gemmatimonadaceae bacterium]|jgi:hypothetical protein